MLAVANRLKCEVHFATSALTKPSFQPLKILYIQQANADVGSKLSVSVAGNLLRILAMQHDYPLVGGDKSVGQNLGKMFERLTAEFLRATFLRMQDLRPGAWTVQLLGNSGRSALCNFAQYEHLAYIP